MKLVIIKKPHKPKVYTIDEIWAEIVSHVSRHPDIKYGPLYNLFGPRTNITSVASFRNALVARGIQKIKKSARNAGTPRIKESLQLTEDVALGFARARKKQGMVHLQKMDTIINRAHEVLEKESVKVKKRKGLGFGIHLKNAETVHRLAKSTYNIDAESHEDKAKAAIAILTDFDPIVNAKRVKGRVTEIDVEE